MVDLTGLLIEVLEHVVEIAVHAQDTILRTLGNHAEQHLLPFSQILAGRNADLELQPIGFEVVENVAPESHIVVPLDKHPDQPVLLRRIA